MIYGAKKNIYGAFRIYSIFFFKLIFEKKKIILWENHISFLPVRNVRLLAFQI
jgi:hypothetical protein